MRILVMLILDTLPMLTNVMLLCFFVFFIFGIIGVQMWKGVLRNRCFFDYNRTLMGDLLDDSFQTNYYKPEFSDSFICTQGDGMTTCADIPAYLNNSRVCNDTIDLLRSAVFGETSAATTTTTTTTKSSHANSNSSTRSSTTAAADSDYDPSAAAAANESCVNWNFYYSKCRPSDKNPFKGAISFDNIGYACIAIFQVHTHT